MSRVCATTQTCRSESNAEFYRPSHYNHIRRAPIKQIEYIKNRPSGRRVTIISPFSCFRDINI